MTKKQMAALERIVAREQTCYDAGVHPYGNRFALTDRTMIVVLSEKPEKFGDAVHLDVLDDCVRCYAIEGDGCMVESPPSADDCKQVIREWKKKPDTLGKNSCPRICITTKNERGETITGWYNAQFCLDALEAAGPYYNVFLTYSKNQKHFPALVVYKRCGREDWHSLNYDEPIILLPLNIR